MKAAAILGLALPLAFAQTLCERYGIHTANGYTIANPTVVINGGN
jgi:hypothetical protein